MGLRSRGHGFLGATRNMTRNEDTLSGGVRRCPTRNQSCQIWRWLMGKGSRLAFGYVRAIEITGSGEKLSRRQEVRVLGLREGGWVRAGLRGVQEEGLWREGCWSTRHGGLWRRWGGGFIFWTVVVWFAGLKRKWKSRGLAGEGSVRETEE